jgi:hypothetical protein
VFSTIPENLISEATLKRLRCNIETANYIWLGPLVDWPAGLIIRETDSQNSGAELTMPFIEFATGRLGRGRDVDTVDDTDEMGYRRMNYCGIYAEVQAAIMDPAFRNIRLTETCLFWMRDTVGKRYLGVEEV